MSLDDTVAQLPEDLDGIGPYVVVVLEDKDGLLAIAVGNDALHLALGRGPARRPRKDLGGTRPAAAAPREAKPDPPATPVGNPALNPALGWGDARRQPR